jgi:starch phosphorylase
MEYLIGRLLINNIIHLDLEDDLNQALSELGHDLEELQELETEAGLGNGGLGRLASCFMESLATLDIPASGYGIRYEFGIFKQHFIDGFQVEKADNWLRQGNPWEIPRPEHLYPIKFYGTVKHTTHADGRETYDWVDTEDNVMAMAFDILIPGYKTRTVNRLRLWGARSTRDFDFKYFNAGNYLEAVQEKQQNETISKVLYPNDVSIQGRKLRLKQEYFFVSASLQDIIKRHKNAHPSLHNLSDKVAIQLNDTHPSLAIPELMRILVDEEGMSWAHAWEQTVQTMAYTNHTVLSEALEKWSVDLLGRVLPRHLQIIYEINRRFLEQVALQFPDDPERIGRMSIIEEEPVKMVRMPQLSIVGSHAVNGVAELHTHILKNSLFRDFHEMFPDRIQNKTNGISPRTWLKASNRELSELIDQSIGEDWPKNLYLLKKLLPFSKDEIFTARWHKIKRNNKIQLARYVEETQGIRLNPDSLFDVHIKRIHEYKRQLMNILFVISLYSRIKKNPEGQHLPRTVFFSGKAAPGYAMAKLIIKLINSVSRTVNQDQQVGDRLKVVFLPNYSVSLAKRIIPAADLSQQISTAGMEASGTGNMKLALNGALTIGTLDGANVEILQEVGEDNIFIFGLKADQVAALKNDHYQPKEVYLNNPELKHSIDMVREGFFNPEDPTLFQPIVDSLLEHGDRFLVLADFAEYSRCQKIIEREFQDTARWTEKSIINAANMGKFSGDRAIAEYVEDIWKVQPMHQES